MKVKVKKHKRKIKGKVYKVKGYNRRQRKLGKKIKYTKAGQFQVAHDELGNIRGSKIINAKKKTQQQTPRKRIKSNRKLLTKLRNRRKSLTKLDTDYVSGNINKNNWLKRRRKIEKQLS